MDFDVETAINTALARKTDLEKAEEARIQEEERAKLKLPTAVEIKYNLGVRMVRSAEEVLAEQPSDFEFTRLAEGLALQGKYADALALTKDPNKHAEYTKILDAFQNPRGCGCPAFRGRQATVFTKDQLLINGEVRDLLACALCGHWKC